MFLALLVSGFGCSDDAPQDQPSSDAAPAVDSAHAPTRFAYESPGEAPDEAMTVTEGPVHLLLITLDTVRADHLGCYGYEHPTTPHLDALAQEALLFETCQASVPVTLPSHCTIITGMEPFEHGVRNNGTFVLSDEITTLAEVMHAQGYATGAVMASIVLAQRFGTAQGFDHFDDDFTGPGAGHPLPERVAGEVTRRGLEWIRNQPDRPWFAWLHYFDPHDPYHPPAPFDRMLDAPYDGEIAYADAHLGGLFRELKRMGLWDRTLIAVTADHGEGLGEHNEPTHSLFIYGTTIDVPLLVKLPRTQRWQEERFRGRRIQGLTATADLLPTLLDALGIATQVPPDVSGRSLVPLIESGATVREHAYLESLVPQLDYGWAPYRGLRTERWKLILAPSPELYDVVDDPAELDNRYFGEPEQAERLTGVLMSLCREDQVAGSAALDPATIEQLRSLGYVAGGGSTTQGSGRDAKEMGWALEAMDRARAHMRRREVLETIDVLEGILARDPTNRYAQRVMVDQLLKAGRPQRAQELATTILETQPDAADRDLVQLWRAEALLELGKPGRALTRCKEIAARNPSLQGLDLMRARIHAAQGDLDRAREAALDSRRNHPRSSDWARRLAAIYLDRGKLAQAESTLTGAMADHPPTPDLLAVLARLRIAQQRTVEARQILDQILQADPSHPEANFRMGIVLDAMGNPRGALNHYLRAVVGAPGNAKIQAHLGELLVRGKNFPKAIEHLQRAIELGDRRQVTRFALGAAFAATGQRSDARRLFERALSLDPTSALADQIRMRLEQLGP